MLTLFAMPKPFRGHIGVIQRNAIASWTRLGSRCHILLFGEEEGTASTAQEFGLQHVPDVARNQFGTPLVSDLFETARQLARHDLLCYVNSDIILLDDFLPAVTRSRRWAQRFLMVGQCWNLDLPNRIPFDESGWKEHLLRAVKERGTRRGAWYIDYFCFSIGLYDQIPPFALGRAGFDNWLIWNARSRQAPVVDATRVVTAIHQNHDYSHVPGGRAWSYQGEEATRNLELAGGREHLYLLYDSTHWLTSISVVRNMGGYRRLRFRWETAVSNGKWRLGCVIWRILELTRPVRHCLGLRMATVRWIKRVVIGHE